MDTGNDQNSVQSEIALFFERWEQEVEAMERGLQGYAVVAKHEIILKRMQEFGEENLKELKRLDKMKEEQENRSTHESREHEENDLL